MGFIQHHTGHQGLSCCPGSSRGGGIERQREKLARGLLGEPGTALLAGNGRVGGCPAHLASPSLPCRAAQPRRVASIAGEDASLVILFLSAFSHLPPSLGSASRRWVDGRLSGAAASPTASPACLTKPAQRFLPFWAKCFLLRAQVTGKSLVSGIQSILCPQPIVGTGEELAGPHREATLIDALVSKSQAAIHSPAARNHEEISLLISLG